MQRPGLLLTYSKYSNMVLCTHTPRNIAVSTGPSYVCQHTVTLPKKYYEKKRPVGELQYDPLAIKRAARSIPLLLLFAT